MKLPPLPHPSQQTGSGEASKNTVGPAATRTKEVMLGACKTSPPPATVVPRNRGELVTEGTSTIPVGTWHFP